MKIIASTVKDKLNCLYVQLLNYFIFWYRITMELHLLLENLADKLFCQDLESVVHIFHIHFFFT